MNLFLLSIGRDRFELYSEPPEEPIVDPPRTAGRLRRWLHSAHVQWREVVDAARQGDASGRFARWRDRVVCHLAETIAEQRTLWALKDSTAATLLYASSLEESAARDTLQRVLSRARRHHGIWLAVDLTVFIASAVLAPIPGPNVIAYYVAFRVIGHWQSWRGARQADLVEWTLCPDADLAELATLADVPRAARASRVDAIAARLNLHRLPKFFERVAV